jgi:electron transfer flavoprotein alpha subunit
MLAVVPARDGTLDAGGLECVAECRGQAVVAGDGATAAAAELAGVARAIVAVWETAVFAPAAWAQQLAPLVADTDVVVLPASADGRALAPRLAHCLRRPLLAGALSVQEHDVDLARRGGLVIDSVQPEGPFVATLQPGVRGVERNGTNPPRIMHLTINAAATVPDAEVVEVLPPDVTTMDLAEAPAIVGGGAGLDSAARFVQLERVAARLDAAMGATRVVTDRGWVSHERQIGTTGVVVDPRLYVAFGISGAVQHTSGLGRPDHIVSVNIDPFCPMMQLADLGVVADANAVLDELADRLGVTAGNG